MTDKEREKLKADEYLTPPVSEKDAAKMLAKELRKSLEKKGYQVDKDELFCGEVEDHEKIRYCIEYWLYANAEIFEVTGELTKAWAENDLSILKTAKEDKEFKKFTKAIKKSLKEAGYFTEPEEDRGAEL